MNRADWDKHLPFDVMAIVLDYAPGSLPSARAVSKIWKESAEALVTKIKIPYIAPVPKFFFQMNDRFTELVSLDLGESCMDTKQLHQLVALQKLKHLKLGARKSPGGWDAAVSTLATGVC